MRCAATRAGGPAWRARQGARYARADLGASVAVDAAGNLWAAYKEGEPRDGAHFARCAAPRGPKPAKVNAVAEPIEASGDSRPKIALGREGEVYVTWTRPFAKFHTGEVRFARSIDGAAVPSRAARSLNTDGAEITHRFDTLAVTPDGKVFDRVDRFARRAHRPLLRVVHRSGRDIRDRSAAPRLAAANAAASRCCRSTTAARSRCGATCSSPGSATTRWCVSARTANRDRRGRATFDDWRVDACPHQGPSLAQDAAGTLHARVVQRHARQGGGVLRPAARGRRSKASAASGATPRRMRTSRSPGAGSRSPGRNSTASSHA